MRMTLELTPEYGANIFGTCLKNIDRRKDSVRANSPAPRSRSTCLWLREGPLRPIHGSLRGGVSASGAWSSNNREFMAASPQFLKNRGQLRAGDA